MFNCFKKYLLIALFLGVVPSAFAMENRSIFNKMYGSITSILPSKFLSSSNPFSKYTFTKESTQRKREQEVKTILVAYYRKKANAELTDIVKTAIKLTNYDVAKIKKLLEYADPNLEIEGFSLAHKAAQLQNDELYEYLINEYNVDPQAPDKKYGKTPSSIKKANNSLVNIVKAAQEKGKFEENDVAKIEELLTQEFANYNLEIEDLALVDIAAQLKNKELFEFLIQHHNADSHGSNKKYDKTPLSIEYANAILIERVENVLQNGTCVFEKNDIEKAKIENLLAWEANPNLTIGDYTLAHIAAQLQNEILFYDLVKYGANLDARDTKHGKTPLEIKEANKKLIKIIENNEGRLTKEISKEIIQCLENGAYININLSILGYETLLHKAVGYRQKDLVDYLLKNGANTNTYVEGKTALHYLLSMFRDMGGHLDKTANQIVVNLLKHNADPNTITKYYGYYNYTPLETVILYNDDNNTLKLLIEYGANVNQKDKDGNTHLKRAINQSDIIHQDINLIQKWLTLGASLDNVDSNNNTALHCLVEKSPTKKNIETVLTCTCPDKIPNTKNAKENIKRTVIAAILTFNRLNEDLNSKLPKLHEDVVRHILLMLGKEYLNNSDGILYKIVYPTDYQQRYIFGKMGYRISFLIQLAQKQNEDGKTAVDLLEENTNTDYKNEVRTLFNGIQIKRDYKKIIKKPYLLNSDTQEAKQNLVWQIADDIKRDIKKEYRSLPL